MTDKELQNFYNLREKTDENRWVYSHKGIKFIISIASDRAYKVEMYNPYLTQGGPGLSGFLDYYTDFDDGYESVDSAICGVYQFIKDILLTFNLQ